MSESIEKKQNRGKMKFEEFNLMKPIMQAIEEEGYVEASPIQEQTIPSLLEGRDVLGCAQTGSGKTAAFALPIIQSIAKIKSKSIRALIVTPTRELAIQINDNIEKYSQYTSVKSGVIFGGVSQKPQVDMLRAGIDILVTTPGRLNDLINQDQVKLNKLEFFVLDEADRMLDMGFIADIRRLIKAIPLKRQTLLFSATMPAEIEKLANKMLKDPVVVKVKKTKEDEPKIDQSVYFIDKKNKILLLAQLLKKNDVERAIVFTNTKYGADKIVKKLAKDKVCAVAIHGDKGQTTRQNALNHFRSGDIKVLIATDIAARGIDVSDLSHVFNYDIPPVPETYVHRIGRTGRAGKEGKAINFVQFTDVKNFENIVKTYGYKMKEEKSNWPMEIFE